MNYFFSTYKLYRNYLLAYVFLLVLLAVFTFWYHYFTFQYAVIPAVIIVCCFILQPKLKQYAIPIFTFTLAVASGIYGFAIEANGDYPVSNVIYSTVRLFALDVDPVFAKNDSRFIPFPPSIEVARWSGVLYIISAISQLLLAYFRQSLRLFWMTNRGNHYVMIGLNKQSYILAENLLKNNRPVLIISTEPYPLENELKGKGAVILHADLLRAASYRKAAIHKAKYLITLHDEDANNLNIVKAVQYYFEHEKVSIRAKNISFFVQQNHRQTELLYSQIEKRIRHAHSHVHLQLHPFSLHDLIARQLFDKHPIYQHSKQQALDINGAPFHMLFIGFGLTGQQMALQAIQRGHFLQEKPLQITVVDRQANLIQQTWREAFPRLDKLASIQFIEQDIEAEDIATFITRQQLAITHVFISLDTDEKDVLQALRLHQRFKQLPIFIKLQRDEFFANLLHEDAAFSYVYRFGALEEVLTEDIVMNERLDEMARFAHQSYVDHHPHIKTTWDELTHFQRQANRALMDHFHTKLFLLGYIAKTEDEAMEPVSEAEFQTDVRAKLEVLAKVEHRRWNSFHFSHGWDALPLELVTKERHKDSDEKLHGCLVEWDELDALSERVNQDFKQYDRDTIHQLYKLASKMGLRIYRIEEES